MFHRAQENSNRNTTERQAESQEMAAAVLPPQNGRNTIATTAFVAPAPKPGIASIGTSFAMSMLELTTTDAQTARASTLYQGDPNPGPSTGALRSDGFWIG